MKRKWDNRNNITTDLAYIAGFFDGEGCVRIKETPTSYFLIAHLTNSNLPSLKFVQKRFGGKINFQHHQTNKVVYQYHLTCGQACAFLKSILGYSLIKKTQIILGIRFHEQKANKSKKWRKKLYQRMRDLKK